MANLRVEDEKMAWRGRTGTTVPILPGVLGGPGNFPPSAWKFPVAAHARAWYGISMATGDSFRTVAGERLGVRQAFAYLGRAALLRCPVCGVRPIFLPLKRVRSLDDWFSPLDGCPRCGYPYEREPGYFLLAIFGFNFGFAVFVGITVFVILASCENLGEWDNWTLLAATALPIPLVNLLVARHAKALFIALDHFCDPHVRDHDDGGGDDDDDGTRRRPTLPADDSGGVKPTGGDDGDGLPYEEEEPGIGVHGEAALTR